VIITTFKGFSQDDGSSYAAALTYYTFLSIFPLLLFGLAALGYITFGNEELVNDIVDAGLKAAPLLGGILRRSVLDTLQERRGQLALTGFVLALYSGSGAIVALEHALNKLHHVAVEPNFVAKRLRSLAWLAILGAAAVASLALSTVARFAGSLFTDLGPASRFATPLLSSVAAIGASTLVFSSAYRFLPAKPLGWKDVLPGAILAAVLFEILKVGGATYLRAGAQNRQATFGVFATAAGLLIASYLVCQITLLCAELNVVLAERRLTRQSQVTTTPSPGGST
jgi:inner membrane protein YhjD